MMLDTVINYDAIKSYAKEYGCKIDELVALSPKNDPFYVGTRGDHQLGNWFADLWQRFGYGSGVHIRRVHYQIISQSPPVLMPNGLPYENTEACWDILSMASKTARYLELVDPAAFVDRRNPEAQDFDSADADEPSLYVSERLWELPSLPELPEFPEYQLLDWRGHQRYHIEIWAEKSTMNDVLLPLCEKYQATLQTGLGELSITATLAAVERVQRYDKPTRILYVSDFDPAGQSMPVAVARKIEYFMRLLADQGADDLPDVELLPVVLTQEQVRQYRLPRTPIKESERRASRFEARFGSGAVELDALEALYPGELARVLTKHILRYYDEGLYRHVDRVRQGLSRELESIRGRVLDQHSSEIDALQQEYGAIRGEFQARLAEQTERMVALWRSIAAGLREQEPDLDDYPIPEAREADELDGSLYDSERDYLEQLSYYKLFQGKEQL